MYKDILKSTAHRDFPLPNKPWLMTQKWNDLLFIHLPISKNVLEAKIPVGLELDMFKGTAWISIISFRISNMHLRKIPPLPFLHSFLEVNVRTYVRHNGIPGVYFFSLDANNLLAIFGARIISLPYFYAQMNMIKEKDTIYFETIRKESLTVVFKGAYKPISKAYYPEPSSLNHWLLERYFLWFFKNKSLFQGAIHHKQWKIQDAEVMIEKQNMLPDFQNDVLVGNPIFHYADVKRTLSWPIKKVEK